MEKGEVESLVAEKVNLAVRSSQNELLTGIQQLISSEVEKLSESQKNFSEFQLSKIAAISSSDYKFKRKSNEEQFKVNSKVLDKVHDCERNIDQAEFVQAKANLAEATSILKQRQKVIRIADESDMGWKVVDEYVQSEVASDEEDQKRIHRAQARASRKARVDRGRKPRPRWFPYGGARFQQPAVTTATVTSQTQQQQPQPQPQQGRLGTCFNCGQTGHWKFECPNAKKNIKLSIIDNVASVLGSKRVETQAQMSLSSVKPNYTEESTVNFKVGMSVSERKDLEKCSANGTESVVATPYNRLRSNISKWEKIGADQYILSVIYDGYKIPFKEIPDSLHAKNNKSARENPDFVTKEIQNLVSKNCVSEIFQKPQIINPLTVAYNKQGKPRLVLDCRHINEKLYTFKFKYEDMQVARMMFEKGTYMFGFDIRSAYNHIDIFPMQRTFIGFSWQSEGTTHYYTYNSLPFGLATAGHIFTKVMKTVIKYLRSKGQSVLTFLDDGLGGNTSYDTALKSSNYVRETLLELGFLLSDEKCQWIPALTITWLGYFLNMETGKFYITQDRIERIQMAVKSMITQLQNQELSIVTARFTASVVGQIISTQLVCGKIVRLKTRELYKCIDSRLSWESPVFISEKAAQELLFWLKNISVLNQQGQNFSESFCVEVAMFCDASSEGYGGYLEFNVEEGKLPVENMTYHLSPEVESVSRSNVFTDENMSEKCAPNEGASNDLGVTLVDRVVSPEAEMLKNGISCVRSPEEDLRVSTGFDHVIDSNVGSLPVSGLISSVKASDKIITDEVLGLWNREEKAKSSTWKETEAVRRVLNSNVEVIKGKSVKIYSDNKNVQSVLKVGSRKEELQNIASEVFEVCQSNDISLSAQWIPRELNEKADYLSRCRDCDDWSVQEWVFKYLDDRWGPHTVDRFASFYNSQCKRFNSRWWVPGTEAVDSLRQSWVKPEINWAVPPPRLIPLVLQKIEKENAICTLIVPDWKSAPFYPTLLSKSVKSRIADTFTLPRINAIKQRLGNNGMFVKEPLSFNMLAIKFS